MIEAFEEKYGVDVCHAWGMTEMTPLGTLGAREVAQADFDVIVVGAGISGLNAAMALEMQNRKVLVLEASQASFSRLANLSLFDQLR